MTIPELIDTINNHTYVVDQWLLDALKDEYNKGSYSDYKNVEALALEFTLYKTNKCKRPHIWRYDIPLEHEIYIDLKRRPRWSNNVSLSDKGNLEESIKMGLLTHFISYTQNIETDYQIGQTLKFKVDGFIDAAEALNEARIVTKTYKLLNKNYLQNTENVV